jgi:hypothetical protein
MTSAPKMSAEDKKKWREKIPWSKRVVAWWNSSKRGTIQRAHAEGPARVLCTIYDKDRPVTSAEGVRSKKESSHGSARKRAISRLMLKKKKCMGERLPNLDGYEFRFKVLEA